MRGGGSRRIENEIDHLKVLGSCVGGGNAGSDGRIENEMRKLAEEVRRRIGNEMLFYMGKSWCVLQK